MVAVQQLKCDESTYLESRDVKGKMFFGRKLMNSSGPSPVEAVTALCDATAAPGVAAPAAA